MSEPVEIIDTTIRDGNQSLWSATGLTTQDVLAIAPTMDRVGFHALDFTSSTHMAVSVRFHREDPWERIRLVSAAMPNTPLGLITTGMRFIRWVPAGEDVMRLAFRCWVRNGMRRIQIVDPSNQPEALLRMARVAREEGFEEVVVGLTYSISPVHTHDYYLERAEAVSRSEDIDRLYLKDPGGLLMPEAVRTLIPGFIERFAPRPVELHSHCTIGLGPLAYVEGLRSGVRTLHTAVEPLGSGSSNPPAKSTLRNVEAEGLSYDLDTEALEAVSGYFDELARERGLPGGSPREFDGAYFRHQMPGGMISTTRRQLQELGRPELFDAVLEEVPRVRAEMGYPIMVTPVSQFVATQAVMNVISGERWSRVSDEMVRYFLGHYYETPAPVDPEVADRVLSTPRASELKDLEPISLDGARERFGRRISDEELLLRLTMPAEQVDAMVAERGRPRAPLVRPGRAPVVRLLRELSRRDSISYLRLEDERTGDTIVWRKEA
ncbi:biotin carboxyl carrier protein [Rubrobacter calidifluminis]|uniref:biotin carboxyl carrier protein n=1 Tax=Rubrobacter calidifluminis TaxID=1392640 RepID=UPI00236232EF|nr:biotin carboxyl carrier protein [Rubrobacter calidifluminis]